MTPAHATDRDSCRALLDELGITAMYLRLTCAKPEGPEIFCAAADLPPLPEPPK